MIVISIKPNRVTAACVYTACETKACPISDLEVILGIIPLHLIIGKVSKDTILIDLLVKRKKVDSKIEIQFYTFSLLKYFVLEKWNHTKQMPVLLAKESLAI